MRRLDASTLRGKTWKRGGSHELIFICPKCGKPKMYVNPQRGRFNCFRCKGVGGVLVGDLTFLRSKVAHEKSKAHVSGHEVLFDLPPYMALSERAERYLLRRGISEESIRRFGLVEGIRGDYMGQGETAWARRIIFPIFSEGVPVHAVGRTYRKRDRRQRYLRPPGGGGGDHVYKCFTGSVAGLFLTEGPIDAIKLDQADVPGMALLGKHLTKGQRRTVLATATQRVMIILDADAWVDASDIIDMLSPYIQVEARYLWRGDVGSKKKATLRSLTSLVTRRKL